MEIFKKYKQYLFIGEWHVHTNFTDGSNSVLEYAELSTKLGIPLLAFTEHVRTKINYDFNEFLKDIEIARKRFPNLIILSGIEAKILPNGTLDCPAEIFNKVDYRLFAFHSFPEDLEKYIFSIKKIITDYNVNAWAHAGLFFKKNRNIHLNDKELNQIFKLMHEKDVWFEFNFKYNLPTFDWITKYLKYSKYNSIVFGGDVHNVEDLYLSWRIKSEFQKNKKENFTDTIDVTAFLVWFVENYPESARIMKEEPEYQWRFR